MALSLDESPLPASYQDPEDQECLDSHLHYVRGDHTTFFNRFYDKPLTLLVDSAGRAGAMGEHSHFDALAPSIIGEYALAESIDDAAFEGRNLKPPTQGIQGWEPLHWMGDKKQISIATKNAGNHARQLIEESDNSVLWFTDYGSDWIKETGLSSILSCCSYIILTTDQSQTQPRCVYSDCDAAGMVSFPQNLYGHIRNCFDEDVQ
jgi:hypothetical protein